MPPHSHSLAKKIYDRVSDLVRKENADRTRERTREKEDTCVSMRREREIDQESAREGERAKWRGGKE